MGRFTGILGLLIMLGLAYAFSTNRRAINKKTVASGLGLQVVFAIFVLKIEFGRVLFQKAGDAVNRLLSYSYEGSKFVFGPLGAQERPMGFIFAFQVLPIVIFIAAFFAVLYHYGIMQFIIKLIGWSGGGYGVGSRMKIAYSRAVVNAAIDGILAKGNLRRTLSSGSWFLKPVPACRLSC